MKNLVLFFTFILLSNIGCQSRKSNFTGTWIAFKVENMRLDNASGMLGNMEILDMRKGGRNRIDSFIDLEERRLLSFEKGDVLLDDTEMFGQNAGKWRLSDDENQLVLNSVRGTETFDIYKIKPNAIMLRKQYEKSKDSVLYTFVQFQGKNEEELKKCFFQLMQKPMQAENEAQIKARTKNALMFYSLYFRTVNDDKTVNSFRPSRVYLPIQFYSGGVGVKPFDQNASWVYLFNNAQDAAKAHDFLQLSLKKVGVFPSHGGKFALEYADVLKEMAENL
ncbi:MAG: hypothetical protein RL757_2251 [Bacteroidota bacterium]|jgi:hypothetical protein